MKRYCLGRLSLALLSLMAPRAIIADQMICIGAADPTCIPYTSIVPDTLDLAESAEINGAVNNVVLIGKHSSKD
ncbi:MAG: hypothetical protein HY717_20900 [Planctomycetes bacterium]|nr:hypothetical protein [Planctomycetota bacterium]